MRTLLGRAQLGYLNRAIIRELSLDPRAAAGHLTPDAFFLFALAVVALPATRFALLLRAPLARRRLRPVEVRGTTSRWPSRPTPRPGPGAAADAGADERRRHRAVGPRRGPGGVGPLRAVAAVLLFTRRGLGVLVHTLLAPQSALPDADYLLAVGDQVRALRPEVAVYFSGSASRSTRSPCGCPCWSSSTAGPWWCCGSGPTCSGWARPAARGLPPRGGEPDGLPAPTVRVALYVANVGKNLHFLRSRG